MAHHLIDACAHAFRESLISERSGDGTVGHGVVIHHLVDFQRGHADVDFLLYEVEHTSVYDPRTPYAFNLLRRFDELPAGDKFAFILKS